MSEPVSKNRTLVRGVEGSAVVTRNVDVLPAQQAMIETAFAIVNREFARLFDKSKNSGLNKDESAKFQILTRSLRELREVQKELDEEGDVGKMTLPELRAFARALLERIDDEERKEEDARKD